MLSKEIIDKCRKKLLKAKADLLNQATQAQSSLVFSENSGGDEADQTVRLIAEKEFLNRNERIHFQLTRVTLGWQRDRVQQPG